MAASELETACPYLWRSATREEQEDPVVPGTCRDPLSGARMVPGFWEYWNRCTTTKHILCRRYRRHRRQGVAGRAVAYTRLRRSA